MWSCLLSYYVILVILILPDDFRICRARVPTQSHHQGLGQSHRIAPDTDTRTLELQERPNQRKIPTTSVQQNCRETDGNPHPYLPTTSSGSSLAARLLVESYPTTSHSSLIPPTSTTLTKLECNGLCSRCKHIEPDLNHTATIMSSIAEAWGFRGKRSSRGIEHCIHADNLFRDPNLLSSLPKRQGFWFCLTVLVDEDLGFPNP